MAEIACAVAMCIAEPTSYTLIPSPDSDTGQSPTTNISMLRVAVCDGHSSLGGRFEDLWRVRHALYRPKDADR